VILIHTRGASARSSASRLRLRARLPVATAHQYLDQRPGVSSPPERLAELEDIQEPGRRLNCARCAGEALCLRFNAAGFLRHKAPALTASGEQSRSYADGTALVYDTLIAMLGATFG
jgi:hypothetical protein